METPDGLGSAALKASLDSIRDAVLITDAELDAPGPTIVYANAAFTELTGYQPSEVIGQRAAILQGPQSNCDDLKHLTETLRASQPYSGEDTYYRKDGTPFRVEWSISPFPEKDPRFFIAVQREVTHLRNLEHHRDELQILYDVQQLVGTAGLDLQTIRQTVANVAMQVTHAEGAAVEEAFDSEMVYTAVAGVAKGSEGVKLAIDGSLSGYCYHHRCPIICPDTHQDSRVAREAADHVGFRSGILVPLLHESTCFGALKVYSSRPHDFSEDDRALLEKASQVLASSLYDATAYDRECQRRERLVDSLPLLISFIDNQLRYREINAAYCQWFDIKPEDMIGKPVTDVIGEPAMSRVRPYMRAALKGEQVHFEMAIPFSRGGIRPVEAEYIPMRDSQDRVTGFYSVVNDISDRRNAEIDHLTGAYNRRGFDGRLQSCIATAHRYDRPLSLLYLDLDHFKRINDRCSHALGDEILKKVAHQLLTAGRESDIVCRWGGEEFAILAPETDLMHAHRLAERLREAIANHVASPLGPVTVSIGLAGLLEGESAEQLTARADEALYSAKGLGRNCVALASVLRAISHHENAG